MVSLSRAIGGFQFLCNNRGWIIRRCRTTLKASFGTGIVAVGRGIRWGAGAILLLGGAAGGWWYWQDQPASGPQYRTIAVEEGPLASAVTANGKVDAVVTVVVGSQLSGQIRQLNADFNSRVNAGDVIARLDADMIEARLAQARADLESARAALVMQRAQQERAQADLATADAQNQRNVALVRDAERDRARKRDLNARGVSSESDTDKAETTLLTARAQEKAGLAGMDGAKAQMRVAEAQMRQAEATVAQREAALRQVDVDYQRSFIRAPIDGVVIERNVDIGQTVAASLQSPILFTIAQDLSEMEVKATVDEADIGRVAIGQGVTFTVNAYPNRTFRGTVRQIRLAPQVVQNVVTYAVVITAANPDHALLPGMTATARIIIDQRDKVLKIGNAALRYRPPGSPVANPGQPSPQRGDFLAQLTEQLQLSPDQQRDIGAKLASLRTAASGFTDLPPEERRQQLAERRRSLGDQLLPLLTEAQRQRFEQLRQERANPPQQGQIWLAGPDGTPVAKTVRLGLTDGSVTEIQGDDLKVGQKVIIGQSGTATARTTAPRLGF